VKAVSVPDTFTWDRLRAAHAELLETYADRELGWHEMAAQIGREMVQASFPLTELFACFEKMRESVDGPHVAAINAHILSVYQKSLEGYQILQGKLTREIYERRQIEEVLKEVNAELNQQRKLLSTEVQAQTRTLRERYRDMQALTESLATQRDELSEMIFAISHDLKSPLNTVGMLLDVFVEDNADLQTDFEDLHLALQTVSRSKKMLDDLMHYSRTLGDNQAREEIDLGKMIPEIVQDLVGKDDGTIATFKIGQLPVILGSEFQIRHLFQNLLGNAIKFRHPDRAPVVRVENLNPLGLSRVGIRVADNGIGIDKAYHEKIFGLFSRLHGEASIPGSGIGLGLCRRVAKNHGGEIRVTSEPGKGASFDVILSQ
jgi:signal transduction histidine kinase